MTSPLFAINDAGALVKMTASPYATEDLLQALIADHPDILHDANSGGGDPRRWLLVTREAGIPDTPGATGRWSVDHLLIDQDGVPTFVEVKRSSDTRIRREVVGQMLDYAANALLHWPVSDIQAMFQADCQRRGVAAEDVLNEYLGEDDPASFWQSVETNLDDRTVRLLFVADVIPIELQRIIEFLNDQLKHTDVLGVEVQQYVAPGGELQVLVPRVIGRTARAVDAKAPRPRVGRTWDEPTFFEALEVGGTDATFGRRLLEFARASGLDVSWGSGATYGTLRIKAPTGSRMAPITGIDTSGKMLWEPRALSDFPPFDNETNRIEIVRRLNAIPGIELPERIANGAWAHIRGSELAEPERHEPILAVVGWIADQLTSTSPQQTA